MSDTNRIEDLLYEGFQPPPSGVAFKLKEILAKLVDARNNFNVEDIDKNPEWAGHNIHNIKPECDAHAKKQLALGIEELERAIATLENLNK